MNADEFRATIAALNLTQRAAGKALGVNERTSRRYATTGVPASVEQRVRMQLAFLLFLSHQRKQNDCI